MTPAFTIELGSEPPALDSLPDAPAVLLLWPRAGPPHLARTALLRRRVARIARTLGAALARIECFRTGSGLESALVSYELARRHFPESYRDVLRLRMPPYVKIVLSNQFPRSQVTSQLSRSPALYYGPFRSRGAAEAFESCFLDLFQMRRCQEDLRPVPDHPGCIYGEMAMCLRPCQQAVSADEYRHEVTRVVEFLQTDGQSLLEPTRAARDRLSADLDFEEAARQHKRLEKIEEALKLRDELVRSIDKLHGVAITRSVDQSAVDLRFVHQGCWQPGVRFALAEQRSMDERLRELAGAIAWQTSPARRRQDHLALLARWFYSSWREGEWLGFASAEEIPYRRLVRAVSRVAAG